MKGKLFTEDFLLEGIKQTQAWRGMLDVDLQQFSAELHELFRDFGRFPNFNEIETEDKIIIPVLDALGWKEHLRQKSASVKARADVPDLLLFGDQESYRRALDENRDDLRFKHGHAFVESKRWERTLDRGDKSDPLDDRAPSTQMLRYLSRVEAVSESSIRWGVLTNGRLWRLYWQGARSRAEQFLELDLLELLELPGPRPQGPPFDEATPDHWRRVFSLMFNPRSFMPDPHDPSGRTFHHIALDEGRLWEERVSRELGRTVFETVFPELIRALAQNDPAAPSPLTPAYLQTVRDAALTWLYRLLFILYAEDRNLLPVRDPRYDDYALRKIRLDIATRIDSNDQFSQSATRFANHLHDLFRALAKGDDSIGVPPYNGGLFDPDGHELIDRVLPPDAAVAPLIDALARLADQDGRRKYINYRDLSVQQLGSIYERLLEYGAALDENFAIEVQPNVFARKGSGSYYTHDALVHLIVEKTVGPLIGERMRAFAEAAEALAHAKRPRKEKLKELEALDPASRLLELRVCDPAMGSGHFLVSLVDYLADQILQKMVEAEDLVEGAAKDAPYRSPLADRISAVRDQILDSARENQWAIDPGQLDDRHVVRRMILKRVVHGVDKNPMAVELAKLALWLHTFTVGAPLSFLDHHLRRGDSLFGEKIRTVENEMRDLGALFQTSAIAHLELAARTMNEIAELTDADVAEVKHSKQLYSQVEKTVEPIRRLLDFWQALRWLNPPQGNGNGLIKSHPGLDPLLQGGFGDLIEVVNRGKVEPDGGKHRREIDRINELLALTAAIARRERFLHWPVAFPGVWKKLLQAEPEGGFDAIIGNPPWDRVKLQEVEWFEIRRPAIARAPRAADRQKMVRRLEKDQDPLWRQYLEAKAQAETAAVVARTSGDYPLLAGGDVNLYSLFVERAADLITPAGLVGLLVPSGIAADKGAAPFFGALATTGRLAALLDFENKKFFFPDVDTRFKFSVFVFGGKERTFPETCCAFFLHAVSELGDPERCFPLGPKDFAAVNPNTGTAPVFRTRRDMKITTAIYERFHVLVDRLNGEEKKAWPVRYLRMFDMTNDSHLFKTGAELDKEGFYPVAGNLWKKGDELFVPLYEGKMVQAYDHRAASVVVHPENLHRPAQPEPATLEQHRDPNWRPNPQYWISLAEVKRPQSLEWALGFKDVTSPTNVRTMIAAIVPYYGAGNTLPLILPENDEAGVSAYKKFAPLLAANFNSFAFDYLSRQKVQGQHLNWYIVEQLPTIPLEAFGSSIKGKRVDDFVRAETLRLSFTATDLASLASDLGHAGPPFAWDENDRRHRRARLDALFFHLYGLGRDDAAYVLDQFPIVRKEDEASFGRFLTKELILAYMNAVAAGDLETVVSIKY